MLSLKKTMCFQLLFYLLLSACSLNSGSNFENPQEIWIPLNGKIVLENGDTFAYTKLISESRCPHNADCIWQGEAVVQTKLEGSFTIENQFSTLKEAAVPLGNYKITLLQVSPYPESGETAERIKVKIERR